MERISFVFSGQDSFSKRSNRHVHRACELLYVISGNCEIRFPGGTVLKGQPGSVFFIPADHWHERDNAGMCKTFFVLFSGWKQKPLSLTETYNDSLIRQWFSALPELSNNGENQQAEYLLKTILLRLERLRELQSIEKSYHPALKTACDYLMQHCCEDNSVGELARLSGVSQSHLNLLFRKEFGMGPARYQTGLRMRLARGLLRNPFAGIADIAEQCGYRDIHYFSNIFKQFHGVSPNVYRKNHPGLKEADSKEV